MKLASLAERTYPERARRWCRDTALAPRVQRLPNGTLLKIFRISASAAAGRRVLFFSDLHWHGSASNVRTLADMETALREFQPGVLLCGGDLCADSVHLKSMEQVFPVLQSVPVRLAVEGNWEKGKNWLPRNYWRDLYERFGIKLLRDECYTDESLAIFGASLHRFRPSPILPQEIPETRILLTHSPDTIVQLDFENNLSRWPLALCGHTHGGQIRLPGIGALFSSSCYGRFFDMGVFRNARTGMKMLLSAGAGEMTCPVRFCCPREFFGIEYTKG